MLGVVFEPQCGGLALGNECEALGVTGLASTEQIVNGHFDIEHFHDCGTLVRRVLSLDINTTTSRQLRFDLTKKNDNIRK